jgi:predicted RND superfamily exporter protein
MPAERMPPDDSPLSQPLKWLTELTLRSPAAVLWGAGILTLVSLVITLNGLKFKTSRLDLLNPESRYNQRWLAYLDEFGDRDDAVIVVRSQEASAVTAAIEDIAKEVAQQPHLFDSVLWRRDLSRIKAKGLHLLPATELSSLSDRLRSAVQGLDETAPGANPAAALTRLNEQLERSPSMSAEQRQAMERQYAQVGGMLLAATSASVTSPVRQASLEGADPPAAAGASELLAGLAQLDPQYLLADEGRMGFVS